MDSGCIKSVSECFIKPKHVVEESKKPYYLGTFELFPMSLCYIQGGLAFDKLPSKEDGGMGFFLERLKNSLSLILPHFYPLTGQLVTEVDDDQHSCFIYIDCNKGPGVKFSHASLDDITLNEIVSSTKVPTIVGSLFELGQVQTNYDGHIGPLLSIQVTEFVDGLFLGVSLNHSVADGGIFWHFLTSWSEIFRSNDSTISRPLVFDRWFPEGHGPIIKLPYTHPDEFITRYNKIENNDLEEVIFQFSEESILSLKKKANQELEVANKISSVQALSALLWRAIARARGSQSHTNAKLVMMANARSRLDPPLSPHYFGNFIHPITRCMKVEDLVGRSLGSVAMWLKQGVEELTDQVVRDEFVKWMKSPFFMRDGKCDSNSILIAGVPGVDLSNIDFGSVGKAVTSRTGSNKYNGRVILGSGTQGRTSVSVEVCLSPDTISNLQQDLEFMYFLS